MLVALSVCGGCVAQTRGGYNKGERVMHCGKLAGNTAAARVFWELHCHLVSSGYNEWVDSWQLTHQAQVTALSTRISEIRHQLPTEEHPYRVEHEQRGHKHFYRLVRVKP